MSAMLSDRSNLKQTCVGTEDIALLWLPIPSWFCTAEMSGVAKTFLLIGKERKPVI